MVLRPEHRRQGLGTRLLAELESQEAPSGTILQCNSQTTWPDANAFLHHHGFEVTQIELLMRRSTLGPHVEPPAGISLRHAHERDDAAWIALHQHGYSDLEDFSPLSAEDLEAERASPGFVLTVAEIDGTVVGLCHGLLLEHDEGLINSVVVHRDVRGRGLGAALTSAGIARLASHGADRISLNVHSDKKSAIGVYRKLGFIEYDRMLRYWRQLEM